MVCVARGGRGMANFFAELKRRHIYRVAAGYAVLAWLLLQLVNNLAPGLNLPNWAVAFVIVLLAVGFPVALFFAWIHQLTPADGATPRTATTKLDYVLAGALIIVIGLVSYQQLAISSAPPAQQQTGVDAAKTAADSPAGAISVAVLPFANMSGDASQAFFSDGITEEITSALVKIPDLRVVGRTSAFQFKDEKRDLRAIGQALNATHLIEGSVRKAGERVRITVQLIKAGDGTHIWSENYDRELTDVFGIQEDIARTVATSFGMQTGLAPGKNLVNNRAIDPESYQQFLRAKPLSRAQTRGVPQAIEILEPLVVRHPDFAPAFALLASSYNYMEVRGRPELGPLAEAAARRAFLLDPNLPEAHSALGRLEHRRGKLLAADDFFSKALALDPNNPDALNRKMLLLAGVGRRKEALAMAQQLHDLEPHVPSFNADLGEILWENGQDAAAIEILTPEKFNRAPISLARIHASMARYNEAADILELNYPANATVGAAARLLRTAPAKATSLQNLPRLDILGFVYLYVGAPERALEYYEGTLESGAVGGAGGDNGFLWHPSYAPVRKLERFKTFVRNSGMVEYWRAKGWPEFCRPAGADDFVCD